MTKDDTLRALVIALEANNAILRGLADRFDQLGGKIDVLANLIAQHSELHDR